MNYDVYWIWMSCGLGPGASVLDLVSYFEWNPYEIYGASFNQIFALDVMTKRQVEKLKSFPLEEAQRIYDIAIDNGWKVITPSSKYYPAQLLKLQNLPLVLYVDGDETILNNELMISVVGARKASDYGNCVARALSSTMASMDFTIVSGGALGVDSAAHTGALDENGKTICVLGCGFGTKYLMDNKPLRDKIVENGALITEFSPYHPASRVTFPLRNRIISGMSLGTVVVEAGERSGSLITARLALEQGKDVFAVPGDLVSSSFLGTNNLIRNGATPVFSPNDIIELYHARFFEKLGHKERFPDDEIIRRTQKYLLEKDSEPEALVKEKCKAEPVKKEVKVKKDAPSYLTANAKRVYDFLDENPKHIDEIINSCGMATEKTLSAITELEIYGLVTQQSGRRYIINN
ncbi:MAG: DNA-processing protein DprA [Clostridia bacterium]|nr:DNA-processing protein DprA [Clostridia bacterium]